MVMRMRIKIYFLIGLLVVNYFWKLYAQLESGIWIDKVLLLQSVPNESRTRTCRDCLKQGQDSSVVIDQMLARPGFPLLGTVSYTVLLLHQVDWCRPTAGSLVQVAAGALVQALLLAHCTGSLLAVPPIHQYAPVHLPMSHSGLQTLSAAKHCDLE